MGEREGGDMQQITAHSNPYSSFSLSFCSLCIRRGFDKNFARSSAEHTMCSLQIMVNTLAEGLKRCFHYGLTNSAHLTEK